MARKFNIHSAVQEKLHNEYTNLMRRTRKYRSGYVEVGNEISKLLEKARHFLGLGKLSQKDVADIRKLSESVHSVRGTKLKEQYVEKKPVTYKPKPYTPNQGLTVSDEALYDIIILRYKDTLEKICTMPSGNIILSSPGKGFGLNELVAHLDDAIQKMGKKYVANMIELYEPPYGSGWYYDSIEHYGFITRITNGEFDVESDLTDEEIDEYYE